MRMQPDAASRQQDRVDFGSSIGYNILNGKGFVPLSVYTLLQHSVMW